MWSGVSRDLIFVLLCFYSTILLMLPLRSSVHMLHHICRCMYQHCFFISSYIFFTIVPIIFVSPGQASEWRDNFLTQEEKHGVHELKEMSSLICFYNNLNEFFSYESQKWTHVCWAVKNKLWWYWNNRVQMNKMSLPQQCFCIKVMFDV